MNPAHAGAGSSAAQRRSEGIERIEREIAREKAAALGRAGERLERAMAETDAIAAAVRGASDPETEARLRRAYADARRRALEARLALLIQREALGLRRHAVVDQQFPEPPRHPR